MIPVFRARTQSNAPAFDPHRICALQLMLSKFEYDGVLNPTFQPGAFQLQIESIQVYREPGADSPLPRLIAIANLPELPKLPDVLSVHLIAPNMPNLGDRCLDILQR